MTYDEKHVIAIWGAPNSGKTTLAANMATILADSGYWTCLISTNSIAELQLFFSTAIPKTKGMNYAVASGRNVRDAVYEARPNLCILEMDSVGDAYEVEVGEKDMKRIIQELRDQFTYVVIDCMPVNDDTPTNVSLIEADKVVMCMNHEAKTATWHHAYKKMIEALSAKTIFVNCDIDPGGVDFEVIADMTGIREWPVTIKQVKSASYCENSGRLIVNQGGKQEHKYKEAVLALIKIVLALEEEDSTSAKANKKKKDKKNKKDKPAPAPKKKEKRRSEPTDYDEDEEEDLPRPKKRRSRDDEYEDEEEERPRHEVEEKERREKELGGRNSSMTSRRRKDAEEEAIRRARQERQEQYRRPRRYVDDDDEDDDD